MIYLIKEEVTVFSINIRTKTKTLGYYECDQEEKVNDYCRNKTEKLKGTYDEDRMDKIVYYEELIKLN